MPSRPRALILTVGAALAAAALTSSVPVHPNDVGHRAIAARLAPIIAARI